MRKTVPDWDVDKWIQYLMNVGAVPFYILCRDYDRYHLAVYGAEYVYRNASAEQLAEGLKWLRHDKNYDWTQHQDALDGRTWGGVDDEPVEGDYGLAHNEPVREQMEKAKQETIDRNKPTNVPSDYMEPSDDPYIQKWRMAEKHARHTPRKEWEGKVDFEFEQMIKYCYQWLRDISEVPQPYPMETLDLFWPRPGALGIENSEEGNKRREYIVGRVIKFWQKSVLKNGEGMDLGSQSYRVVLAAMKLEKLIEKYCTNFRRWHASTEPGTAAILDVPDKEIELEIRAAADQYFKAHFPVQMEGAKPGPITTLDPDYVGYIQLCRKYNLEEGVLLHEVEL